ncbi:hypothetical protein B1H29_31395 [Streptomyces pactum]|uniref:Urease accessory protein UreG n=1 Tax=Streptomyces pactum TaxID=68249 RepID=A0A1S6JGC3_9ACTN|nr:hypothetical protein B1H29_31395 [Streptomyces pactum]
MNSPGQEPGRAGSAGPGFKGAAARILVIITPPPAVSADAHRPDGCRRALRIGLAGPVGSGKTATVAARSCWSAR